MKIFLEVYYKKIASGPKTNLRPTKNSLLSFQWLVLRLNFRESVIFEYFQSVPTLLWNTMIVWDFQSGKGSLWLTYSLLRWNGMVWRNKSVCLSEPVHTHARNGMIFWYGLEVNEFLSYNWSLNHLIQSHRVKVILTISSEAL